MEQENKLGVVKIERHDEIEGNVERSTLIIESPGLRFAFDIDPLITMEQIRNAIKRLLRADLFHKLHIYFFAALLGGHLPTKRELTIADHDLVGIVR